MKKALITGVTGQDGAYLARFLLLKGYEVHGMKRRSSSFNTSRIDQIYQDPHEFESRFFLHHGDMSDGMGLIRIIESIRPDEIYNLAAMSHVHVSFEMPEYTADSVGIGTLRILEAVRILGLYKSTRIYQASTSELYGLVANVPQTESTPFHPRSPYAVAKMYAFWMVRNYREAYGIFASNGILFNHESPIRGETFVTRKITRAIGNIVRGKNKTIKLGNINSLRDWGHAADYVRAMWLILQHNMPDDFVIATGKAISVRDFLLIAFKYCGIEIEFIGKGVHEKGIVSSLNENIKNVNIANLVSQHVSLGDVIIEIDPYYFRPSEVDQLLGDASKAKNMLNWVPSINIEKIIEEMCDIDVFGMEINFNDKFK